jgi:hypothetical protein
LELLRSAWLSTTNQPTERTKNKEQTNNKQRKRIYTMKKINHEQVNKVVNYVATYFGAMAFGACLMVGIECGFDGLLAITTILSAIVAGTTAYNLHDMKKYEKE